MTKRSREIIGSIDRSNRGRNNKRRGKTYERRVAKALGGVRNIDSARPHTDVETDDAVYEIKSTQSSTPAWLDKATSQLSKASIESKKDMGGVIKVYTKGKARAFLIQEIEI